MKNLFKKSITVISAVAILGGIASTANAGTTYYVYQKGSTSTCDISTKAPSDYNRGSKYHMVASDSTRSGAKKQGQGSGCSSF